MAKHNDDWGFGDLFGFSFDPSRFEFRFGEGKNWGKRRRQMFESGEVKFVILRLLREKPRHGYEVIKALEERMAGCYTASAGTVYPTLQLLEDQGYVRSQDENGKRVYHITPEGEAFLEANRDLLDDIFDRVRDTVRDFAGGHMADLNHAFSRLASSVYRRAWRRGPDHPSVPRIVEILKRAAEEVEREWERA
ncbi:MAG: PadR family transcriptional regulator [Gemmatimonadetes bacterium]|nr:PadR family transcriptional regulator [Gemmatimonadota bacterium]MCC7132034.1 PadR family transcriptional regulator [Gemmatimonadales bacterium]